MPHDVQERVPVAQSKRHDTDEVRRAAENEQPKGLGVVPRVDVGYDGHNREAHRGVPHDLASVDRRGRVEPDARRSRHAANARGKPDQDEDRGRAEVPAHAAAHERRVRARDEQVDRGVVGALEVLEGARQHEARVVRARRREARDERRGIDEALIERRAVLGARVTQQRDGADEREAAPDAVRERVEQFLRRVVAGLDAQHDLGRRRGLGAPRQQPPLLGARRRRRRHAGSAAALGGAASLVPHTQRVQRARRG
mmetsp:Transcript_25009/g.99385  ORF Transcript_25009/g.99385 Transcript_25009/m.99385 type:complete len:255 (+) Transcript_25009:1241-2005(+)